ncbi:hypothetical protein [uncultured Gilvimarinus sp.]|uniref:hypothetical protein n=1 Tax=uncultured Gilvimarinus sp. TaxID=1689143 RepID=UPI0030EBC030|tara:strand:- start:3615 stop:4601 length:987 start_codon:yes stop_codon:yes gene_type:complete
MVSKRVVQKNKKFYYRRAKWSAQEKITLEDILVDAHEQLGTVGKRSFSVGSGAEITGAAFKVDNGLYLQIASYVPDESTSIIDKSKRSKQSTVSAQAAPDGKDYIDGDVFVYIKGNHVILCPSGIREQVAETYILNILRAVDKKDIAKTFELDKVAKTNKLRMIKEEGVKEIDLNTSLYEASLIHLNRNNPKVSSIKKAIADQVIAIFGKDKDLNEIKEKENVNVGVSLKYDGRAARSHQKDPEFGVSGKKRLERTAEQIISEFESESENENGFTIVTNAGNKITSDEIRVSDSFRVDVLGKSLSQSSAWKKLKEYHDRLAADGVFSK